MDKVYNWLDEEYYESFEWFWKEYDKEDYPDEESIMDNTFYWAFGDSFIIQQF